MVFTFVRSRRRLYFHKIQKLKEILVSFCRLSRCKNHEIIFYRDRYGLSLRDWLASMFHWFSHDLSEDNQRNAENFVKHIESIQALVPDEVAQEKLIQSATTMRDGFIDSISKATPNHTAIPTRVRTGGAVNDVLEVWGHTIHESRLEDLRNSPAWSIMINETADVSK